MSKPFFEIPKKPPSYTKYSSPAPTSPFKTSITPSTTNTFGSLIQSAAYQTNTFGSHQMSQPTQPVQPLPNNATTLNYSGVRNSFTGSIAPSNHGVQASQQLTDRPLQTFGNLPRSNSPQGSTNTFLSPFGQNAFGGYTSNRLSPNTSSISPNISNNYPRSLNVKLTSESSNSVNPARVMVKCVAAT